MSKTRTLYGVPRQLPGQVGGMLCTASPSSGGRLIVTNQGGFPSSSPGLSYKPKCDCIWVNRVRAQGLNPGSRERGPTAVDGVNESITKYSAPEAPPSILGMTASILIMDLSNPRDLAQSPKAIVAGRVCVAHPRDASGLGSFRLI